MANPAFSKVLKDKEVVYAVLTGDGVEGDYGSQYSLGIKMTRKEKDKLIKEVKEFFDEKRDGERMARDPEDWFSEDEEGDGYVFWVNAPIDADVKPIRRLKRKRATGTRYGMEEFETIGAGSIVDAKVRFYIYNVKNGEGAPTKKWGINRALSEVVLKEYVPFEGADDGVTTEGEEIGSDGIDTKDNDKYADLIEEINDAIDDEDADEAKKLLKKLPKEHSAYKKLKKAVKAI